MLTERKHRTAPILDGKQWRHRLSTGWCAFSSSLLDCDWVLQVAAFPSMLQWAVTWNFKLKYTPSEHKSFLSECCYMMVTRNKTRSSYCLASTLLIDSLVCP